MFLVEDVLGECDWDIVVEFDVVDSELEATEVAKRMGSCQLVTTNNRAALCYEIGGKTRYYFDDDVTIRVISPEKKAQMGPPIDATKPGAPEKILESLKTMDPAYVITEEDMIPSTLTLADFVREKGEGYQPESIAYGVSELTQDNCRHILGTAGSISIRSMDSPSVERHILDVQYFSAMTGRFQVSHPGYLRLCAFCPRCGAKIDREANEAKFQEKLTSMGGFYGQADDQS